MEPSCCAELNRSFKAGQLRDPETEPLTIRCVIGSTRVLAWLVPLNGKRCASFIVPSEMIFPGWPSVDQSPANQRNPRGGHSPRARWERNRWQRRSGSMLKQVWDFSHESSGGKNATDLSRVAR